MKKRVLPERTSFLDIVVYGNLGSRNLVVVLARGSMSAQQWLEGGVFERLYGYIFATFTFIIAAVTSWMLMPGIYKNIMNAGTLKEKAINICIEAFFIWLSLRGQGVVRWLIANRHTQTAESRRSHAKLVNMLVGAKKDLTDTNWRIPR